MYVRANEMNLTEYVWEKYTDVKYIFGIVDDIFIIYK